MLTFLLELLGMLLVILIAAELFTNALEHFGERLGISEGVTGSLFAAVGTALPETLIPLLALFAGTSNVNLNEEVGVGAILGAPLMLSTLSTCLMACVAWRARGLLGRIRPERTGLQRDLNFFLVAFSFAAIAMYLSRIGLPTNLASILLQLLLGLALLVLGAKGFIHGVEGLSHILGISALLLSLLIIPIATELPEKINSILWVRRGKDTLAFGNISGAMVFQGTLLPAIGILLTPWEPRIEVLTGVLVTLGAALWLRINAQRGAGLPIWVLMLNGVLYAAYLGITLSR